MSVEPSTRGFVFGWIDFNGDGLFDETPVENGGEKIFDGVEVTGPSSLTFDVPEDAIDLKYARFRFTSMEGIKLAAKGLAPGGVIPDGEIEDYVLLDLGDAPDSYATSLANDGPRHFVKPNVFLGSSDADIELDGQVDAEAQGDDHDNTDDEEGITFLTPLYPGETAQIEVDASAAGFLFAWFDFNNDGQFQDDPASAGGERVFSAQPVAAAANQKLEFTVPAHADVIKFARFRYTTEAGVILAPNGVKPDGTPPIGEVEDYALQDLGDAPDQSVSDWSFPTRRTDDGARHYLSTLFLGVATPPADGPIVDDDGRPDRFARQNANEKSIAFTSMILPGMPAEIKVQSSKKGLLNAFMDWNADGDWEDPGEQIFSDQIVEAGENTLAFTVPAVLEPGIKYLRF
ncbi:MAG: hypothetical protein KDA84_01120, partial [Planctomycetaceae bacterium]|nr:hypothetical protein [Planctomycetaceae bacterium]